MVKIAKKAFVYDGSQWQDLASSVTDLSNYANLTTTPVSGFRNIIINGDFRINQRGFSNTTINGTYGFDRWLLLTSDGTCTYSSQAFTVGNAIAGYEPINFARVVTTGQTLTSANSSLRQYIEDVRTFAGQTVTVSFWAKANSGTPKIAIELDQQFGSGGSTRVTTYGGQITLSTSWVRYSVTTTLPSISGKTIGTSSFLGLHLWFSTGSDFNARTGSLGIQSNTFDIWGVQVEKGTIATPFEQRPIGTELALCQRYYVRCTGDQVLAPGFVRTGTMFTSVFALPVEMRTTPTIETNATTGVAYATAETGGTDWGNLGISKTAGSNSGTRAVGINASNGAATMVDGRGGILRLVNSAAYVGFVAEL